MEFEGTPSLSLWWCVRRPPVSRCDGPLLPPGVLGLPGPAEWLQQSVALPAHVLHPVSQGEQILKSNPVLACKFSFKNLFLAIHKYSYSNVCHT